MVGKSPQIAFLTCSGEEACKTCRGSKPRATSSGMSGLPQTSGGSTAFNRFFFLRKFVYRRKASLKLELLIIFLQTLKTKKENYGDIGWAEWKSFTHREATWCYPKLKSREAVLLCARVSILNASPWISSHQETKGFPVGSGEEGELVQSLLFQSGSVVSAYVPSTMRVPTLARQHGVKGVSQAGRPYGLNPSTMFGEEDEDWDKQVNHALVTWGAEMNEPTLPMWRTFSCCHNRNGKTDGE